MIAVSVLLAFGLAAAAAVPTRIVGGSVASISQYPQMASMLQTRDGSTYSQTCGGSIINTRSILTAAHCTFGDPPISWRARVGSTWANSGGIVHSIIIIINHPDYNRMGWDSDISIVRTASPISYVNNAVQPGTFAGPNYYPADNSIVWAAGWGLITEMGPSSEQLRHVQIWTVNQGICRQRYGFNTITDNMLCSGWLDVGGRDQCTQDSGGPLYHNGIVVGVCSFGTGCGRPQFPGVNTRVSRFSNWMQANA